MPPTHLAALIAYAAVLLVELPRLAEQLRANSDVASVLLLGNGLAAGTAGRPIEAGQPAYAWLVSALEWAGHESVVWSVLPVVITWLGLAGTVLSVARVAGRWAVGLALALGIGAAPAVLLTEMAPAFHGMAWGAVGLLGWYTVSHAEQSAVRARTVVLSCATGILAGAVAASDALVIVAGLLPLAVVAAMLYRRSRRGSVLAVFAPLAGCAAVSFAAIHLLMARGGYSSGLGGGTTRAISLHALAANAHVVGRGLLDMTNGLPMDPAVGVSWPALGLAVALIGLTVVAACLVAVQAIRRSDSEAPLARQAHVLYWLMGALLLLGALLVSNVVMPGGDSPPADRMVSSQRYLTGLFFAAVALVPLSPRGWWGRVVATAAATAFVAASAARVTEAQSAADFQPTASRALPVLAQALRAHGLAHGYASYWDADVLRWASGDALYVLPAAEGTQCGAGPASFCRDLLNSVGGWFLVRTGRSFVVVDPSDSFIPTPPPSSLGAPIERFAVDRFTVFVYSSDVLTRFATSCAGRADHDCAG